MCNITNTSNYNITIHNSILMNKFTSIVIIRPVIIVTIWNVYTYIFIYLFMHTHTCVKLITCETCIIIKIINKTHKIIHLLIRFIIILKKKKKGITGGSDGITCRA